MRARNPSSLSGAPVVRLIVWTRPPGKIVLHPVAVLAACTTEGWQIIAQTSHSGNNGFPLIEPDRQISRTRLSEKTHALAHGKFAVRCGNWTRPYTECRDVSGKRLYAGRSSLCLSHNHRRSLRRA